MIERVGKCGVRARILKDSVFNGQRLTTFEVEYWRGILAELNTHRMLSRNSASSRAIPFDKMMQQLGARPVRFGEANKGMQDKGEDYLKPVEIPMHLWQAASFYVDGESYGLLSIADFMDDSDEENPRLILSPEAAWEFQEWLAKQGARGFKEAGYHKQVYNRLVEPFQMVKSVISATEWNNFFWLRDDGAADPSIRELARCMREAREASVPTELKLGEWHLPYIETEREDDGGLSYSINLTDENDKITGTMYIPVDYAVKVSAARCAAVSYRNNGYGLEKSFEVHDRLVGDDRKHASALEHQAMPIEPTLSSAMTLRQVNVPGVPSTWQPGVSHFTRDHNAWSGNFRGWVQYRKLIAGENVPG